MTAEKTVYVVDDDPAVLDSLRELLEGDGLEARCFSSPGALLDAVDAARPGCVVADLRMPKLSGIELQEQLAGRGVSLPLIIITGHGDIPQTFRALQQRAVKCLEKPFRPADLIAAVREGLQCARTR